MQQMLARTQASREDQTGADRRIHPRKDVSLRVDYANAEGRAWLGIARNLSCGGMFLEYTPELSVGDTVTTTFALPTGSPCRLLAQVVHKNGLGSGLKFLYHQAEDGTVQFPELEEYCAA